MAEEDMRRILKHPLSMVGSDGLLTGGHPNPRSYGTFPYVLGQLVREEGLLRLEEAVRKMSAIPAQRLGLKDRGILRDGMKADIVVQPFDTLLMHFAESLSASVIVRGLRAVADFEYEFQMTAMNQRLNSEIETVFLMADPRHQAIASRLVKEIARLDGKIESFVSPAVAARVRTRVKGGN